MIINLVNLVRMIFSAIMISLNRRSECRLHMPYPAPFALLTGQISDLLFGVSWPNQGMMNYRNIIECESVCHFWFFQYL